MPDPRIRRMRPADVDAVVGLVHELADYEKAPDECHLTADQLTAALFCERPALYGHVAVVDDIDGVDDVIAGCALWFLNFSTWRGVHGIYLEDLYVQPERRGSGLGKALLTTLAEECAANGYQRLEWWVLNWNTPAIEFYESLGAEAMSEWTVYRLTDAPLTALARESAAHPRTTDG